MSLDDPISSATGVGQKIVDKFSKLKIHTIEDLLLFYPRQYDDFSNVSPIGSIRPGNVTLKAHIKHVKGRYGQRGLHITEAVATDKTGSVRLIWFNQHYREKSINTGQEYYISGVFGYSYRRLSITNPSIEQVQDFTLNTARIVPRYKETKGLKSHTIRKIIKSLLEDKELTKELLPDWIVKNNNLISKKQALTTLHFPNSLEDLQKAKRREGFDEIFYLSLASAINKQEIAKQHTLKINFDLKVAKQFVNKLPFTLTDAQRKVIWKIINDLQKDVPMSRLLEGDVGSGKTVVAAFVSLMVIKNNFQVALMAPTELLAKQHADTIHEMLKSLGMHDSVSLIVGSMSKTQKNIATKAVKEHKSSIIVGTHSLIQENIDFKSLALVIIDEQHRFGVVQRTELIKKAGHMPHVLSMTATPIPRSLALSVYGELDISILDEMPKNRKPVITSIESPNSLKPIYTKIKQEIASKHQAYVVCPIIEDSEVLQAYSAESIHKLLKGVFKGSVVDLIHSKMKPPQKDEIMKRFVQGKIDVLVSTTIVEVGVDVPNATVMMIMSADRFGLAQIHQLRGRVGRGERQGYCYLVPSDSSLPSKRLRLLEQSTNGFELAEKDLALRGPGALYGLAQHGRLDLRLADLTDKSLIQSAKQSAVEFVEQNINMVKYPYIQKKIKQLRAVTNLN